MKFLTKIYGVALLAFMLLAAAPKTTFAQDEGQYISTQEFYDELSPYGTWVYDAKYGDVWVPDVDQDFRPYVTNGHWVYTSYGNTWVSDYEWGWATFHYGRWAYDDYYGWEWVPGSEWAPAWVDWREGDGYYGWAPLTPGISFDVSFGSDYYLPDTYWSFAPYAYINSPNIYNYCVPYARVRNIYGRSNFIRNTYNYNNRTYITGPRREEIQRYTKRPVRLYTINNIDRPSRNTFNRNTVNFYRPDVRRNNDARPARVIDGAAYRTQNPNQRIGGMDRRNGAVTQRGNAGKLANEVRSTNPDRRYVRVNNGAGATNPAQNARPDADNSANRPGRNGNNTLPGSTTETGQPAQQTGTDRFNRRRTGAAQQGEQQNQQLTEAQRQQQQQAREQRQQQGEQQNQQLTEAQRQQQQQAREQRQQQREQQNQQLTEAQRQQQEQVRQQRQQQQEQQRQQQTEAQRQQQEQARQQRQQQQEQQRQQQTDAQRQQQEQARQQRQQQQEQQRQQQTDAQRQQQEQVRQQRQQQQEQQRQQQTEAQRQQQEQARQQRQQQQEQQRQQQEQQRQQQQEQQRQQQEQAKQQQQEQQRQQQEQQRPVRPARP